MCQEAALPSDGGIVAFALSQVKHAQDSCLTKIMLIPSEHYGAKRYQSSIEASNGTPRSGMLLVESAAR
jgi:hypothetical protein